MPSSATNTAAKPSAAWRRCANATLNGENPALTETGLNYVCNFPELKEHGMGIMYFGGTGAGKSHACAQIVNALTDKGYDCLFTSFRNILTNLGT